jgi:type VI secretion system protein ImpK
MQAAAASPALVDDDIADPGPPQAHRNVLMANAAKILALAASVRAGRAQIDMPALHAEASRQIAAFEQALAQARLPDETRQRAKYALCATIDDIAQNLPGNPAEAAEWARRSMVVQFFQEAIGGDRFWQLVDFMLKDPRANADLIELYHACLAAGFEGRFRVMSDGKSRLHEVMTRLYGGLEHARTVSPVELSPHWRGTPTERGKVGFWSILALAAGAALALLLLIYIVLRLVLMETGRPAIDALQTINPDQPLRLSRIAPAPPPSNSGQAQALRTFLAPEIAQRLVVVEEDGQTVRVRTTNGQLFASGSDKLEPAMGPLIGRIAAAIAQQPPQAKAGVRVEGYTDSDKPRNLTFPDNQALSSARAQTVADMLRGGISGGQVTAQGFGDAQPIAPNSTAAGKSLNRRVEIVVPRVS